MTIAAAPVPANSDSPARSLVAPSILTALLAVVIKELRQHIVTGLGLVGVAGVVVLIACLFQWQFIRGYTDSEATLNILFLPVTEISISIALPGLALLLGMAQLRGETSLDSWGFLVHRPASRLTLFAGRTIAGIVLLFVAAGVPLAAFIAYCTTADAGQIFHWRFLGPSAADFLSAFVYYLAGVLFAQSTGFFLGPRLLPIFTAFSCSFLIHVVGTFSMALLVIGVYAGVFLVAAGGAFVSRGFNRRAPGISQAARILISCTGFSAALCIPNRYLDSVLAEDVERQIQAIYSHPTPMTQPARTLTARVLLPNGTMANRIYKTTGTTRPFDRATSTVTYTTLDGVPLPNDVNPTDDPAWLGVFLPEYHWQRQLAVDHARSNYRDLSGIISKTNVSHRYGDTWVEDESWFFIEPEQRFYIYLKKPRTFLGTFGQNGFKPPGELAEAFDPPDVYTRRVEAQIFGENELSMFRGHAIFEINMGKRTIRSAFTAMPAEVICQVEGFYRQQAILTSKRFILNREAFTAETPGEPHKAVQIDKINLTIPITHSVEEYNIDIHQYPEFHTWSVRYWPAEPEVTVGASRPGKIYEEVYDDTGKLIQHYDLDWMIHEDPPFGFVERPEVEQVINERETLSGIEDGITSPALAIAFHKAALEPHVIRITSRHAFTALGVAAVFSLFTFLIARRYGYSVLRAAPWVLGTLCFGLPVVLTFLATHALPRRAACPKCGKGRYLGEAVCPRCKAEWAAPVMTGTEIFAG